MSAARISVGNTARFLGILRYASSALAFFHAKPQLMLIASFCKCVFVVRIHFAFASACITPKRFPSVSSQ
jgi:hypothetical protein